MNTDEQLFDQFMLINQQLSMLRYRTEQRRGPLCSATRGQGRVLSLLQLHDGVSARQMAQILGIRVSSLNETLSRMEARGLIVRTPSEEDRRVTLITLTQAGRQAEAPERTMPQQVFGGLDDSERETLGACFDKISRRLDGKLDAEDSERLAAMRESQADFEANGPRGRRCCARRGGAFAADGTACEHRRRCSIRPCAGGGDPRECEALRSAQDRQSQGD